MKKFNDKQCVSCNVLFTPISGSQKYCPGCSNEKDRERKKAWYIKNNPDAYKPKETTEKCSVCESPFSATFDSVPYCNKHFLRMYNNGTLELKGKKKNSYTIHDDAVIMTTHKGEDFTFDVDDLEKVSKYSWCISKTGYLVANVNKRTTKLHRYILELTNPKEVVDHINGNPMDNRKENLRVCINSQNSRNGKIGKNNQTGYPGVRHLSNGRYRARLMLNRKEISLGTYNTFEEAKRARIDGELKHFDEFAPSLNVIT